MTAPRATARLQLHAGFTLADAYSQAPYYARLGISHLYLSPISQARPGSMHGYDVVNHEIVNPELGGEGALVRLARRLREHKMGLILDIVPNHMATHANNSWWWNVLQLGASSAYANWFDIDWASPDPGLRGKVLAPFLAHDYGRSLTDGSVRLMFDDSSQSLQIEACGARYPLAPGTLPGGVNEALAKHDPATPDGRQRLHELLERQHYRLSWWRCAADSINWRRFFDISELIGVRVEHQPVFEAVHALPLRLFSQGLIDGLRIDHIDGLAQPLAYCRQLLAQLKARSGQRPGSLRDDEPWLIVEKILAHDEILDERWAAQGTTGYDFMDQASAVLHDGAGEPALTRHWAEVSNHVHPLRAVLEDARRVMLKRHFPAERKTLLRILTCLAHANPATRDWSMDAIGRALDVLLTVFPVYRTYVEEGPRCADDTKHFALAMDETRRRLGQECDGNEQTLLDALDGWLGGDPSMHRAIRHFQQLTPPLAAKSLEDTAFYRYGRLLSRNEVGSDPGIFALSVDDFHHRNAWRAVHAPRSMLATATHDQKRGEDARARLAVLSEIPERWIEASRRWMHAPDFVAPIRNPTQAAERYMLLQTLVGTWPLDLSLDDEPAVKAYAERIVQWQTKALREAKLNSSWLDPDSRYEQASAEGVRQLLSGPRTGVLSDIEQFVGEIAPAGALNSLAQTVMRVASPGVPDLYQGTEFWDFSLVDPDNRRPVDFEARCIALDALDAGAAMQRLASDWRNGRIKQAVLCRSLRTVRDMPIVFAQGRYLGLPVSGAKSAHALAFLRTCGNQAALVVIPRLSSAGIIGVTRAHESLLIDPEFWGDTHIVLPSRYVARQWRDALAGGMVRAGFDGALALKEVLAALPVALMVADGPVV